MTNINVAIIGAGFSGCVLAEILSPHVNLTLFEKSRGAGGRMASKISEDFSFDYGAQFFTVRNPAFDTFIQPYLEAKIIKRWDPIFVEMNQANIITKRDWKDSHPHYVATPGMNAWCREIATHHTLLCETEITELIEHKESWSLRAANGQRFDNFDWVISTCPVAQSRQLLPPTFSHQQALQQIQMLPCFTLMLGLKAMPNISWQAALIHESCLSWVSCNHSKPDRSIKPSLTCHARNSWAESNLEAPLKVVEHNMLEECLSILPLTREDIAISRFHRWRYANINKQDNALCYFDKTLKLGACGDWCIQGRVEAAFNSAKSMADRLLNVIS